MPIFIPHQKHNKMAAGDWKEMLDAVQKGNLELVKHHIKAGVNPNYQHPELLTTPLIQSIELEHIDIATFLLENGADPTIKAGFSTDSPLSIAKTLKNKALIQLLRQYIKKPFWKFWD